MRNHAIALVLAFSTLLVLFGGCAAIRKSGRGALKGQASEVVVLPSENDARVIAKGLLASEPYDTALVYPVQQANGPCIYAFLASRDSLTIRVAKMAPKGSVWALDGVVGYPCLDSYENGLYFAGYEDSLLVHRSEDAEFVSFGARMSQDGRMEGAAGGRVQHVILLFKPATEDLESLCFSGRILKDGRVEGSSNRNVIVGMERPWLVWAAQRQDNDPRFVFLSEADAMTDQAVEWWLGKNPSALTTATSVKFGALPAESSLAAKFEKARGRQTSNGYTAALFDYRGYTVVVARKSGKYLLLWAEPECTDHARGRLLNNIYFEQGGSTLVLFYYQGKKAFKYRLNLSSGSLRR